MPANQSQDLTKLTQSERDKMPAYAPTGNGLYVLANGLIGLVQKSKTSATSQNWKIDTAVGNAMYFLPDGTLFSTGCRGTQHEWRIIGPYTPAPAACEECERLRVRLSLFQQRLGIIEKDGKYLVSDGELSAEYASEDDAITNMLSSVLVSIAVGNILKTEDISRAESENTALKQRCEELDRQLKVKSKIIEGLRIDFLCPDHRDKQRGKACLACTIARLEAELAKAKTQLEKKDHCHFIEKHGPDGLWVKIHSYAALNHKLEIELATLRAERKPSTKECERYGHAFQGGEKCVECGAVKVAESFRVAADIEAGELPPLPAGEGWVRWNGGRMPFSADRYDANIECQMRSGNRFTKPACEWRWSHNADINAGQNDVMFYRLVPPPAPAFVVDKPEIDELRKRFEEWASIYFTESRLLRFSNGKYNPTIEFIWEAFIAGAKTEPVPSEVMEAVERLQSGYLMASTDGGRSFMVNDQREKDLITVSVYAIANIPQLKGANDGN